MRSFCRSLSLAILAAASFTPVVLAQAASDGSIPMPGQSSASGSQMQAGPSGTYTLTVKSQIVQLDVVVTDKKGNLVENLTKDDFDVYEDDDKQRIRFFEAPQKHVLPAGMKIEGTRQLDKDAPDAPVSLIVLDEINTKREDEYFAKYSLKKYLNTLGDTLVQPTMLIAVDMQNFMVLQDYTTDKKKILDALDHHLARNPWHLENGGKSYLSDMYSATYNALMQVAQATQGHPGHKNMLWVGTGFPSIDTSLIDDPEALDQINDSIQTCVMLLRDARITLYWVDAGGVRSVVATENNGLSEDALFNGDISMSAMASATGGRAFFNRNDVDALIDKSATYGNNFYTLTYSPTSISDDPKAFRKIRVVMKNPLYKAVAREGYYPDAPPPPPMLNGKPSDRLVYDLSMAARSMMIYDSVPIHVTRDDPKGDAFTIRIDESSINWTDNGPDSPRTAEIAVLVATFDRKGKLINRNAQNLTAEAPPLPPNAPPAKRAINVHTKMNVSEPAARMRIVVRVASTGKVGSDNILFVPKSEIKNELYYNPKMKAKKKNDQAPANSPANILNNREEKARGHRM